MPRWRVPEVNLLVAIQLPSAEGGDSVPSKVFELEPILPNLTKMEGFLRQNY